MYTNRLVDFLDSWAPGQQRRFYQRCTHRSMDRRNWAKDILEGFQYLDLQGWKLRYTCSYSRCMRRTSHSAWRCRGICQCYILVFFFFHYQSLRKFNLAICVIPKRPTSSSIATLPCRSLPPAPRRLDLVSIHIQTSTKKQRGWANLGHPGERPLEIMARPGHGWKGNCAALRDEWEYILKL